MARPTKLKKPVMVMMSTTMHQDLRRIAREEGRSGANVIRWLLAQEVQRRAALQPDGSANTLLENGK